MSSSSVVPLVLLALLSILSISGPYQGEFATILGIVVLVPAIYAITRGSHMAVVCCLLLFIVPEYAADESGYLFHISPLACAGLVVLAYVIHFGFKKKLFTGYWEPAAIFAIMMLGTLINPDLSVMDSSIIICIALAVIGIGTIRGKGQIRDVALTIWFAGTIIAMVSLLAGTREGSMASMMNPFYFAGNDPNYFGFVTGLSVACALGILCDLTIRLQWWLKLLIAGSIILIIASLSLQGSRSAAVAIAASFIAFLFLYFRNLPRNWRTLRTLMYIIVIVVVIGWLILFTPYGAVWLERFTGSQSESMATASNRTVIWDAAFRVYLELPVLQQIFGSGYGASLNILGKTPYLSWRIVSAHNMFIAILLDGGLVSLLLLLVFFGRLVYRGFFRSCMAPELSLILLVYCVAQGLFLETQRTPEFWCAICLIVAGVLARELDKSVPRIESRKRGCTLEPPSVEL
jgi:O-antigen ligase